jgi:peptidoglycan/LPS O-acetylase OafA/YrhL
MGKQQSGGQAGPVQRVELTGKNWKFLQLLGGILLIPGVVALIGAGLMYSRDYVLTPPALWMLIGGGVVFAAGLTIYARGRFGAWWYHG